MWEFTQKDEIEMELEKNMNKRKIFQGIMGMIIILFPHISFSSHGFGFPELGLPMTNSELGLSMMFANPPMPRTTFEKGKRWMTPLVSLFIITESASIEPVEGDTHPGGTTPQITTTEQDGSIKGFQLGFLAEWAKWERISLTATFLGTFLGSGTIKGNPTPQLLSAITDDNFGAAQILQEGKPDSTISIAVGIGINYQLFKNKTEEDFTMSFFGGPFILKTIGKGQVTTLESIQTITNAGGTRQANSSNCKDEAAVDNADAIGGGPGYDCVNRNYKVDTFDLIGMVGFQMKYPIFWKITLNPYLLYFPLHPNTGDPSGEEGGHGGHEAEITVDKPVYTEASSISSRTEIPYQRGFSPFAFGLNIIHRPTGLSANVFGFLTAPIIASQTDTDGFKTWKFTLSQTYDF